MCGIIGVALNGDNVGWILSRGLKRLEYRGYDSVGVAVVTNESRVVVLKQKGDVDSFLSRFRISEIRGATGIGHTRWATHGEPSDTNAHPHTDCSKSIYLVHNGVIRNYDILKEELASRGHTIESETDTELIAHIIEEELASSKDLLEALAKTIQRINGTYALAILYSKEPDRIYYARRGSPLVIGLSERGNILASDIPALLEFTRNIVVVEDEEIGWISNRDYRIYRLEKSPDGYRLVPVKRAPITAEWTIEEAEKGGYPHFMIKEIMEQPLALASTYDGLVEDPKVYVATEMIASSNKVLIVGAGSSYNAGCVTAYYLVRFAGIAPITVVSSEHRVYDGFVDDETVVVAISQSGETFDTLEAIREYKRNGAKVIGITNIVGSALARESHIAIYMRAGPEIGVAATKTYLSQVLVGGIIAVKTGRVVGKLGLSEERSYLELLGLAAPIVSEAVKIAEERAQPSLLGRATSTYILGRGLGSILAREAALKVKEVAYVHAEAYPAGESKHGPIALVEKDFPVLFIATSDSDALGGNVAEMMARGARTVVVKPSNLQIHMPRVGRESVIEMPATQSILLEPFSLIPFFQMLAYKTAVARGFDPDKPRNLAKTVTVE